MADDPFAQARQEASGPGLIERGWTWLRPRGLTQLGVAAIAAAAAAVLFGAANLIRGACEPACGAGLGVPAGILETCGFVAVLMGIAAVGHWIGHLAHRTWQDRLRLEADELGPDGDPERLRRIERFLAPDGPAQVHLRARVSLWTAAPVTVVSMATMPSAGSSFAEASAFAPYLMPIVLLSAVAGLAATIRGIAILTTARRLARPGPTPTD